MRIQELRARLWAYDRQIGRIGIIRCFEAGCQSQSEMAEFWDVTEEFMIILSVAGFFLVVILNTRKNPALQDSPPAAGRASVIFHSAAVRSSRSVFMS